jgi:hypothetical protein
MVPVKLGRRNNTMPPPHKEMDYSSFSTGNFI